MDKLKLTGLCAIFLLTACVGTTTTPVVKNSEAVLVHSELAGSCMHSLWKALLPLMAANNSYISVENLEHVTGVRMQYLAKVSPTDTVGIYQQGVSSSFADSNGPGLSFRIETHEDTLPSSKGLYTWQSLQWHPGSTSVLDLSCINGTDQLRLTEAEADLRELGLRSIGITSGTRHMEVFVDDWNEQTNLYYDVPVNTVPYVLSIHVVGEKVTGKPKVGGLKIDE